MLKTRPERKSPLRNPWAGTSLYTDTPLIAAEASSSYMWITNPATRSWKPKVSRQHRIILRHTWKYQTHIYVKTWHSLGFSQMHAGLPLNLSGAFIEGWGRHFVCIIWLSPSDSPISVWHYFEKEETWGKSINISAIKHIQHDALASGGIKIHPLFFLTPLSSCYHYAISLLWDSATSEKIKSIIKIVTKPLLFFEESENCCKAHFEDCLESQWLCWDNMQCPLLSS